MVNDDGVRYGPDASKGVRVTITREMIEASRHLKPGEAWAKAVADTARDIEAERERLGRFARLRASILDSEDAS